MSIMPNYCSLCSTGSNLKKYCSKFVGSLEEDASYYCNECYDKVKDDDDKLIKFSIQKGENIANIVKQKHIIEYVNPTSSTSIIKPMNIYKIVSEVVDGVLRDFVMIDFQEYNNYMLLVACSNKKLIDDEILKKKKEYQERQEAVERRKIEAIQEREQQEKEKQKKANERIEMEAKINRYNNEKIKKEKEELREQYAEVFKNNENSKIIKCGFCKSFKIFPFHFKDENETTYLRTYTKDKKQEKAICCIDCYEEAESRKEDKKLKHTHYCEVCDKRFVAYTNELYVLHLNSIQHKRNENKKKGKIDLSLLNVKELNKICSKTLNEDGLYRINNYSKMKKNDLLEKMNAIYDLLVFN